MDIISWIKTTLSKYSSNSTHDKNAIYFVKNEDGKTGKIISDEIVYGNGGDANGVVVESPNQPTEGESVWVNPDEDMEEVEVYSRQQTDALINTRQKELTLTINDNGNIVIGNIQGQTKEFMPATPSGDPMHYAYVAAGAEYNDTGTDIIKTTPWADMADDDADKTVVHKAGYWYLNGLGNLTNNDMLNIMQTNRILSRALFAGSSHKFRTNLTFEDSNAFIYNRNSNCSELIRSNINIEVLRLPYSNNYPYSPQYINGLCNDASKLIHIINILDGTYLSSTSNETFKCNNLRTIMFKAIKYNVSFSMVLGLTLKSVLYMINNEIATSAITITLHSNVYNRCMANADILAALKAHTNISLASA